jgi:REP element-mobilizing transposase RayT
MLRGNDGQNIFFCDADRCRLCLLIQQGVERYGHRIHAFCLMTNHIHLLVQVNQTPLSKIVHNLAFRYSQDFNRRYGKIGHLFQGRYKAILLDEVDYFLKLVRYIHMNPVRANMVRDPSAYFWSGHRAYLGENEIAWLSIEHALKKFDVVQERARKLYNDYILKIETQEELNELRSCFKDGQVLGNNEFTEAVRETYEKPTEKNISLSAIVEAACTVFSVDKSMLSSPSQLRKICLARGAIAAQALENGLSINEIAKVFKRDKSTISHMCSSFLTKYRLCDSLKQQTQLLKEKSTQLAILQA